MPPSDSSDGSGDSEKNPEGNVFVVHLAARVGEELRKTEGPLILTAPTPCHFPLM